MLVTHSLSLNLQSRQDMDILPSDDLLLPGNFTAISNNSLAVAVGTPTYDCVGGSQYGDRLPLGSCRDAQNRLFENLHIHLSKIITFKDRNGRGGSGIAEIPLPYLALSCKSLLGCIPIKNGNNPLIRSIADGLCAIEIVSANGNLPDSASIGQMRNWAQGLITKCSTNGENGKGGFAANLGAFPANVMKCRSLQRRAYLQNYQAVTRMRICTVADKRLGSHGNLGLVLSQFDPSPIECVGLAQPNLIDCLAVLSQMPTTKTWQTFGKRGDSGTEVILPHVLGGRTIHLSQS